MKIDFVAYHSVQALCGQSVFDHLSKIYDCRWVMGPFANAPGGDGDIAVMLDHRAFHELYKSPWGYKYLFHLSHDLGDLSVYRDDNLKDFDLIFVPTNKQAQFCRDLGYSEDKIIVSGWAKYDLVNKDSSFVSSQLKIMGSNTIIYAPTYVLDDEWRSIFQFFSKLNMHVIIKNHVLVDSGQDLPMGEEEEYRAMFGQLDEMEADARRRGFAVAPRNMNIVELFLHSGAEVVISDISSCLLEFIPFGLPIETGGGHGPNDASLFTSQVKFIPAENLTRMSKDEFSMLIQKYKSEHKNSILNFDFDAQYGEIIAENILSYISENKPQFKLLYSKELYIIKKIIKFYVKLTMKILLGRYYSWFIGLFRR